MQRQAFFDSSYYMNYFELDKLTKITSSLLYKNFHLLPSMVAQQTLRVLDKNWKSFFESIKDYKKNPNKYTGRPKPPKYLDKDLYFNLYITDQSIHYENDIIRISCFSKLFKEQLKLNTKLSKIKDIQKINQIVILPRSNKLIVEIIYTKEINSEKYQGSKCIGIDIGVDNLLAISGDIDSPIIVNGKGLKSINHLMNADINGSLNILKKSKVACDTLERIKSASRGLVANPIRINVIQ